MPGLSVALAPDDGAPGEAAQDVWMGGEDCVVNEVMMVCESHDTEQWVTGAGVAGRAT
jgi:hypothetical protein